MVGTFEALIIRYIFSTLQNRASFLLQLYFIGLLCFALLYKWLMLSISLCSQAITLSSINCYSVLLSSVIQIQSNDGSIGLQFEFRFEGFLTNEKINPFLTNLWIATTFEQRPLFCGPRGGRCTQVWLYCQNIVLLNT